MDGSAGPKTRSRTRKLDAQKKRRTPETVEMIDRIRGEVADLLPINEVADLLGTSPAQARNMVGRGQLAKPLKVPGLGLRWRAAELIEWINNLGTITVAAQGARPCA